MTATQTQTSTKKTYWIRRTIDYCPACGSEQETRERVYGEKPKDGTKRVILHEVWDYCEAF